MSNESSLIVISASARAAVWSARQADFSVSAVDQFGDVDLREVASSVRVAEDWPRGVVAATADLPAVPWVFGGGLENRPELIEELAASRELLGCSAASLKLVRDPFRMADCWREAGLSVPRLLPGNVVPDGDRVWLRKPVASAGGIGVQFADSSARDTGGVVLQEFVPGDAVSGLFLSNGQEVRLLGMASQLVGSSAAGAGGFVYCGSIWPTECDGPASIATEAAANLPRSHALRGNVPSRRSASSLPGRGVSCPAFPRRAWNRESDAFLAGEVVVRPAGLVGLFGIDFVRDAEGTLWPIEVNPRYPASAEQCERATGWPLMRWHVDACRAGSLPTSEQLRTPAKGAEQTEGKVVVYAPSDMPAPDLQQLAERVLPASAQVVDIPAVGSRLRSGAPVCSILTSASSEAKCRAELLKLAGTLRSELLAR